MKIASEADELNVLDGYLKDLEKEIKKWDVDERRRAALLLLLADKFAEQGDPEARCVAYER